MADLLNGEIIAPFTGWEAVATAAFVFSIAAVIRRLRVRRARV